MRTPLLSLCALAACSGQPVNEVAPFDIGNAAGTAQGAIDNYAGLPDESPRRVVPATPQPARTPSPAPAPTPSPSSDGVSETPFTPDSAQGAANVVQTYYALLEARKYRQAWRLWDNDGRASGMSAEAFAASFDKYREYHAQIGAPGEIDAGAGQRHVSVPVKVSGRLEVGNRPFAMRGPVTLHRTAEIEGATVQQQSWRISDSGVRLNAAEAAPDPR